MLTPREVKGPPVNGQPVVSAQPALELRTSHQRQARCLPHGEGGAQATGRETIVNWATVAMPMESTSGQGVPTRA